ncbi:hypothetical protein OSB04_011621 [Centaurea solstitialis]|uniref:Tf2-1-like SH3-like domain-containing protein n=1 Tax=Centaurea solstitialis TaxID=347529 RepID=A0AA38TSV4_9ASTR|nr:hypothetical protein OSB04_011621 [Centaurea solstitialis]
MSLRDGMTSSDSEENVAPQAIESASKKVQFAVITFTFAALQWWNTEKAVRGIIEAKKMSWDSLKELMTKKYSSSISKGTYRKGKSQDKASMREMDEELLLKLLAIGLYVVLLILRLVSVASGSGNEKKEFSKAKGGAYVMTTDEAKETPDVVSAGFLWKGTSSELMPMCLGGLNIVLGMDWLFENDAQIMGNKKTIKVQIVQTPAKKSEYVRGDRKKGEIEIILMLKIGVKVILKVSPWKGITRFGKTGKLSPRYVGKFAVIARVGVVAYRLKQPAELSVIQGTLHVSNIRKCLTDESTIVELKDVSIDNGLSYKEERVQILNKKMRK